MKSDSEQIAEIFGDEPRNARERKERELILNLHTYVFKDPHSIDALCKLIFFYREEIAAMKMKELNLCGMSGENRP